MVISMLLILLLVVQAVFAEPLFGGKPVKRPDKFKQMASVFVSRKHRCGGTLITSEWVLTASHCFINMENDLADITVILGKTDVRIFDKRNHIESDIIIIHKNYNVNFNRDDVALVHLKRKVKVTLRFQIPNSFQIRKNVECSIAGYGSSHTLSKNLLILHEGRTKLISKDECARSMSVMLAKNTVCTKNRGTTPCGGDSGGALMCGPHFIGVISHGPTCHKLGMPSVYAFTPAYKKWITRASSSYKSLAKNE